MGDDDKQLLATDQISIVSFSDEGGSLDPDPDEIRLFMRIGFVLFVVAVLGVCGVSTFLLLNVRIRKRTATQAFASPSVASVAVTNVSVTTYESSQGHDQMSKTEKQSKGIGRIDDV